MGDGVAVRLSIEHGGAVAYMSAQLIVADPGHLACASSSDRRETGMDEACPSSVLRCVRRSVPNGEVELSRDDAD